MHNKLEQRVCYLFICELNISPGEQIQSVKSYCSLGNLLRLGMVCLGCYLDLYVVHWYWGP